MKPSAAAAAEAVLSVEDLSISFDGFPDDFALVNRVSLAVRAGRTLCLVGESGCGKSLISLAIMGLLATPPARIKSGRVMFEGRNLLGLSHDAMADIRGNRLSMIFQEPMTSLNPAYTIGDQIGEVVERHKGCSRAAARARALEMLRRVRIPAAQTRLDAYPHQLSGGMRQRAMIAMALANDPRLLIADEPTTALDVTIQAQVLRLVRDLQRETGTAMILVTHDLGVVAEIADDVAVMYAGQVVESGPVGEIFDHPQHPYTLGLMGSLPSLGDRQGKLVAIPGTVPPPKKWPRGCRFSTRCPLADERCRTQTPPLIAMGEQHFAACFKAPLEVHAGAAA